MPPLLFARAAPAQAPRRGDFKAKWNYLPPDRQNLPSPGSFCPVTPALRQTPPGPIFLVAGKSMFKQS